MRPGNLIKHLGAPYALALICNFVLGIHCAAAILDWNELMRSGQTLAKKREYANAERYFNRALVLAAHFPQDDPRLITNISAKARCVFMEGKYDLAEML